MTRILVLSGTLVVTLVASYLTWTDDSEGSHESAADVPIYSATPTELQRVTWSAKELVVQLERRSDAIGDYVWVSTTERRETAVEPSNEMALPQEEKADEADADEDGADDAPEAGEDGRAPDGAPADTEPEPEMTIVETHTAFLGKDSADETWEAFAPLHALRELPVDGTVDPTIFGFEESTTSIEVVNRAGTVSLRVGGETFGRKDRYIQRDAQAFLVAADLLKPLQNGTQRLMERRLHPLAEQDVTRVEVLADGTTAAFVQENRDDRALAYWARAADPSTKDENVDLWLGKVFRLKATSYPSETETPEREPVVTIVLHDSSTSWEIAISKDTDGAFYAQSPFNRALVALMPSLAAEAVEDLAEILQ